MSKPSYSKAQRAFIEERANSQCEYCKSWQRYATQTFHIDHIIPLNQNGPEELDNLAFACGGCNGYKRSKTKAFDPVFNNYVPLFHPRNDKWEAHFIWNENHTMIIGITSIGRAPVQELKLNRSRLVNMRKLLGSVGRMDSP